jgi:hypothetical protein
MNELESTIKYEYTVRFRSGLNQEDLEALLEKHLVYLEVEYPNVLEAEEISVYDFGDVAERYGFIENHFIKEEYRESSAFEGMMFETYGEEIDFVKSVDPKRVFTLIEGEDNASVIESGMHYVNRIGYFISKEPHEFDEDTCYILDF